MQIIEIPYLGMDASHQSPLRAQAAVPLFHSESTARGVLGSAVEGRWHPAIPNDESAPIELLQGNSCSQNLAAFKSNSISLLPKTQKSIDILVASILEKFPLGDPAVISFVCSEHNPHLELSCFAACRTLASMHVGRVLMVDSTTERKLSSIFKMADNHGLSNLLVDSADWEQAIESVTDSDLEFLAAGTSHWEHWGGESELRKLVSHLKKRYQFILVASGEAHSSMAKLWSGLTDGDYLLVSIGNSHPAVAESAISELQASGARLMGCIVTDHA